MQQSAINLYITEDSKKKTTYFQNRAYLISFLQKSNYEAYW